MTPLHWTGIACAAVLAAVALWVWLWPRPRIRAEHITEARRQAHETVAALTPDDWPDISDRVRAADQTEWQDEALTVVAERDQARAEQLNRALRLAEGDHSVVPWPHESADEAAVCLLCSAHRRKP